MAWLSVDLEGNEFISSIKPEKIVEELLLVLTSTLSESLYIFRRAASRNSSEEN